MCTYISNPTGIFYKLLAVFLMLTSALFKTFTTLFYCFLAGVFDRLLYTAVSAYSVHFYISFYSQTFKSYRTNPDTTEDWLNCLPEMAEENGRKAEESGRKADSSKEPSPLRHVC